MDKIEIEFGPFEGDKLTVLNKDVVANLSQYLHLKDNMETRRHIIVAFIDDEREEIAVNAFVKESRLNGIMIVVKRVLRS